MRLARAIFAAILLFWGWWSIASAAFFLQGSGLAITFAPSAPSIAANVPTPTNVSAITTTYNGSPVSSTLGFGAPNNNDGGLFAISGTELITNGSLAAYSNTTQNVTVTASCCGTSGTVANGGSTNIAYAARTNTILTAPTGIQNGDLLFIYFDIGAASPPTPTPPAGFTVVPGFPVTNTLGGFSVTNYAWYKFASSESGNYTVSHASASSEGYIARYTGVNQTTPFSPAATTSTGTGGTSTATGLTTAQNGTMVVFLGQDWGDTANNLTGPTGTTPTFTKEMGASTTTGVMYVADGVMTTAAATGTKSITNNSTGSDPWFAALVAIQPAAGAGQITASANLAITVTPPPPQTPVSIAFNPASPVSVQDNLTTANTITAVSVTTSDGLAFPSADLSITVNPGSRVALSGSNVIPAHNFTSADDGSNLTVTVQASENGTTISQSFTLNVTSGLVIFTDNFSGTTLNPQWEIVNRHGEYAQDENECNAASGVSVNNGLTITLTAAALNCGDFNIDGTVRNAPASWPYTTGDIQTKAFNFRYGTVTVTGTLPNLNTTTWPAIWFLQADCQVTNFYTADTGYSTCPSYDTAGSPGYQEIDMVECWSGNGCQMALHNGNGAPADQICNYAADTTQHTYVMSWGPSAISLTRDGVQVCNFTANVPNVPMFMLIQNQACVARPPCVSGPPTNANLPAVMTVSSVSITAPAGSGQRPLAVSFNQSNPVSVSDTLASGQIITGISVTTSDGNAFTGTLSLLSQSDSGMTSLSSTTLPSNIRTAKQLSTSDNGYQIVNVSATENNGQVSGSVVANVAPPSAAQAPGPSAALFSSPPYTCTTNFYVSTSGASGNAGTQASPWDITSAFNSKNLTAGTCVNIADGVYQPSTTLDIHGSNTTAGSSATPSGYVVFRAYQTMDGPHIEGTTLSGNVIIVDANAPYIWLDGLNIDGQATTSRKTQNCIQGSGNSGGTLGDGRASHHLYITNSILQFCGQAGFQGGNTDYQFLVHDTIYHNAFNAAFVYASGISIYEPLSLQGYTGTNCSSGGDCSTNKALAYDSYWCGTGSGITAVNVCYSLVVAYTNMYFNYNQQTGAQTSDGEGYESDDWAHAQNSCTGLTPGCPFDHNGLVLGNVFYGNGGPGYEVNGTGGGVLLVADNTAAYNFWDPYDTSNCPTRGDFEDLFGGNNHYFINNVAISNHYTSSVGCTNTTNNYGFVACCGTYTNSSWQNNVAYPAGQNVSGGATFPTVGTNHNLDGSNPLLVNSSIITGVGTGTPILGAHDTRLCQSSGTPGGCTGTSPAISFGQGSFSSWQQTTIGAIDSGACIIDSPGPVSTCPIVGDSLP
jgi:hypothetical protein